MKPEWSDAEKTIFRSLSSNQQTMCMQAPNVLPSQLAERLKIAAAERRAAELIKK
jgi:hypothetical protein